MCEINRKKTGPSLTANAVPRPEELGYGLIAGAESHRDLNLVTTSDPASADNFDVYAHIAVSVQIT